MIELETRRPVWADHEDHADAGHPDAVTVWSRTVEARPGVAVTLVQSDAPDAEPEVHVEGGHYSVSAARELAAALRVATAILEP